MCIYTVDYLWNIDNLINTLKHLENDTDIAKCIRGHEIKTSSIEFT